MTTKDKKEGMWVASICNGTVIDHIPPEKLFKVVALLGIHHMNNPITVGNNFESQFRGKKGIIKIADRFLTPEEISRIAIIAPHVHLNIIREYEVVEKHEVSLPENVVGIVRCSNPKCITNHEPMQTHFRVTDPDNGEVQCKYCGRKIRNEQIEIL